jgi:hypothetical protein
MQIAVKRLQPAVCNHVSNLKPKLNQLTKLEKAMNRTYRSFIASLVLLVLFGVMTGCRETPINTNPVPRGSQFVGEINGVVRDGNTGAPLSGVTLRLIGPDGDLSTTTNADGIYVFRNLQAGTYKITAVAPAGYAPTRTRDVVLTQAPNQSTGVAVVRVARDIRFFTANAAFAATLQYQTPDGRLLPVPAGTPVFINFVKQVNPATGLEETVGDVQVALVRDSVRANGAVSITGLPAVGALSQASPAETPRFIVPTFTVGGVTYGNPDGKALNYPIAGLRPGVTFTLPPTEATIRSTAATLPLALTATNMNSRTDFGTTDTIFVAFNKPISTFSFSLFRTQTPYFGLPSGSNFMIASTAQGSLIATALPAGAVPQLGGTIVGANQAFAIRLNRPFVTGSEHRLDIDVTATDGTRLFLGAFGGAVGARTFTTVPGIRLLSVTAGNVTLSPTTTTVGVPTRGTITFTFDRPPVGQYFTRGPLRNVRFASGSDIPGGGRDERDRVGIQGETNRIDCVGVITGNSLSFGYRNLVGPAPNVAVGLIYQIHTMLVNAVADQPVVSDPNVAPGTPGNFRSNLPGDFGVGVDLSNLSSVYSSFRAFTAAVRDINIPRIVSAAVPANPDDSVRITFTRPMNLRVGQRFTALSSNIRMFRTDETAQPYGLPTGTAIPLRISSTSSSGDTTTYFLVRDERRDVDGAAIPFEGNTDYTLEISADLTSSDGVRLRGDANEPTVFTFSGRTAGQQFAGATVGGVAIAGANTRVPTSGNIELRFTRPIRQDVEYRTRGLKQNFELVRISAVGNPNLPVAPTTTDLGPNPTTVFIDAVGATTTNTITFGYRGLHRNTRYALRAISPPAEDFFRRNVTLAQIPEAFYNVRWADFPNDPGVGFTTTATGLNVEYNNLTGNRLDVRFVTQEAEPARLIASNTDANPTAFPLVIDSTRQTSLTNPIRLTFSKEMERNAGSAFTLKAVASPYFPTPYFVSLKATWNAAGTEVSLVPSTPVSGDTARTLEAGTTYELTINTSLIRAVDGGGLVPLIRPITFTTQPEIRLVDVKVNNQSFSTTPGLPINAGDTVGTITLTFSKDIGGRYNVRGPLRRFVIIEDSSGTDLSEINATTTSDGTAASVTDTTRAALVDSLSVVEGNTLTIRYRISRQRLKGRRVAKDPTSEATTYLQNRIIRVSLISTSFGDDPDDYKNLEAVPNPRNIRGKVRGDLGVRGVGSLPQVTTYSGLSFGPLPRQTLQDDIYLNDRPALERFGPGNVGVTEFAFYFSTGGTPTSQSFPDLVISSVRNAAESVSQAAKQTVSTVRGWWKRFRGE